MKAKEIVTKLSPYTPGKSVEDVKRELGLEKIVKLASNENPFGYSPLVKQKLVEELEHLEIYPDGYTTQLRDKLAERLGVKREQLIFGNGSDEIVQIICRTFLEDNTNTIMATPTFPQYRHNAVIEGAEVREIPTVNGYHNLDEMLNAIDNQTRVVWLCTPNNPTGNYINEQELKQFMDKCPAHVLVVVDEAYYEYVMANNFPQTIPWLENYPNLLILRTFSKAYGLAALRIGYGIGNTDLIRTMEPAREPFNTSTLAQAAAFYALDDQNFVKDSAKRNKTNMQLLMDFCDDKGLKYFDSQANFLLIHLPITGDEMTKYLMTQGFIVRSGEALGIPNSIRITIGSEPVMKELIDALERKLTEVNTY